MKKEHETYHVAPDSRKPEDPGFAEFKRLQQMSQDRNIAYGEIFYKKNGELCIDIVAAKKYLRLNDNIHSAFFPPPPPPRSGGGGEKN
jgi:hypothetical protein